MYASDYVGGHSVLCLNGPDETFECRQQLVADRSMPLSSYLDYMHGHVQSRTILSCKWVLYDPARGDHDDVNLRLHVSP